MGLSSSKSKTTSNQTATTAPNAIYAPQIDSAAATLKPAYDAAQANNTALQPRVNSVLDYYSGELSQPLTGNPYLEDIIGKTRRDVTDSVSSRFEGAGRYGSGMYAGALGTALADSENGLRYNDYTQAQARRDAAARGVLGATGVSAALPQAAAGTYADQVRALLGGYTTGTQNETQTTVSSPSLLQLLIQAGSNVARAGAGG
jgi:hypothetical protein